MGILDEGAYGPLKGKLGNMVSYNLKGKNVIRMIGHSNKPPTEKQLARREEIKIANVFLKPIKAFINLGFMFKVEGTDRHAYNEAVSYNKLHAISGSYPNQQFDYSKAMVSAGTLEPALNPTFQKTETGVTFSWDVPALRKNDRAMLLIYFPDNQQAICILSGNTRSEGTQTIALSAAQLEKPMHAYISFFADDRMSVSDSTYLGSGT